jgi:hypothetical protein
MRDRRGGEQFNAEIEVVAVVQRGMLASASSSEVFNTAVLDGSQVQSALTASMVYSWYRRTDVSLTGSSLSCIVPSPTTAFAVTSSPQGCELTVAASNVGGVSQRPVRLVSGEWQADVPITVWYPVSVTVSIADATLNRIVDASSDQVGSRVQCVILNIVTAGGMLVVHVVRYIIVEMGCMLPQGCNGDFPFQRSKVTAIADWGGEGLDTIADTDVTPLVGFVSENEGVVSVIDAEVQGVSVGGPLAVSMQQYGAVQASTEVRTLQNSISYQRRRVECWSRGVTALHLSLYLVLGGDRSPCQMKRYAW